MEVAISIQKAKEALKIRQQHKLEKMLSILKPTSPIEIGIYGSYARGDYKATSDLDMYVLYYQLPSKIEKGELYEEAAEMGIDLLICEYNNFFETDSVFCKNVLKDRKIIWAKEASHEY